MKYVILKADFAGVDRYIHAIFPEFLTHSFMMEALNLACSREWGQELADKSKVFGAGLCYMNDGYGWDVESGSTSLGIERSGKRDMQDYKVLNSIEAMNGLNII